MTHPPATCELCGGTGLYSPSALPCPKGCKDVAERLRSYAKDQGGWHHIDDTCEEAADLIERLRQALSEAQQREKDAYQRAYETRLKRHKSGCACHLDDDENIVSMCELHRDLVNEARAKALEDAARVAESGDDLNGDPPFSVLVMMRSAGPAAIARQAVSVARSHVAERIRALKNEVW